MQRAARCATAGCVACEPAWRGEVGRDGWVMPVIGPTRGPTCFGHAGRVRRSCPVPQRGSDTPLLIRRQRALLQAPWPAHRPRQA
eukprot:7376551-Prymnesium_polylepis.1